MVLDGGPDCMTTQRLFLVTALVLLGCSTVASTPHPADGNRAAVEAYFHGFLTGDFSTVPLAPDVIFTARGSVKGETQLREELRGMANTTRNVVVHQISVTGNHACAEITLESKSGKLTRFVDCFDFSSGNIIAIRVYLAPAGQP